jgi:hypothetical protein
LEKEKISIEREKYETTNYFYTVQAITAKGVVSILQQSNGLNGIVPAITVNLNK